MINRIFIRGDTHGDFTWLSDFCEGYETTIDDVLIILGDSALRFEGPNSFREKHRKEIVAALPITLFVLRGNHDRPYDVGGDVILTECPLLDESPWYSRAMWHDESYPNIWYFQDGGQYKIKDKTFLTIGGAYSVDKEYRQFMHWTWYEGEQLDRETQLDILDNVDHGRFDYILTHTCPYSLRPTDLFLTGIDQSKVDNSTELWLEDVFNCVEFSYWLFGHYHENRCYGRVDKYEWHGEVEMLFDRIKEIGYE